MNVVAGAAVGVMQQQQHQLLTENFAAVELSHDAQHARRASKN